MFIELEFVTQTLFYCLFVYTFAVMNFPSVSLVIPCFNEVDRIERMFEGIHDFISVWKGEFEIVIVDDGSDDGGDILINLHPLFVQHAPCMQLIRQANMGKGGALKTGVAKASKNFVLTLDADMATSPNELINWLNANNGFHEHEVWIGSRELKNSVIQELPLRKWIGNVFNLIIRTAVGIQIHDTQCGFKLYPTRVAQQIFSSLVTLGWAHDVELLVRAQQLGCRIVEMPVSWRAIPGSKIRVIKDSWKMFWEVMRIRSLLKK